MNNKNDFTFYVLKFNERKTYEVSGKNFFILTYVDWDDYSRKTTFNLEYCDSSKTLREIGSIKIMHENEFNTINIIPPDFKELTEAFCSLGQDIEFYQTLEEALGNKDLFNSVLNSLNDVAFFTALREKFDHLRTFNVSLLRTSEASKAFHQAQRIIEGLPVKDMFIFNYVCKLKNAKGKHIVDFNFGDNKELPNRIFGLVGKNGTGKTQFLAQLALDLSGQSKKILEDDVFSPSRPLFSKVIAVSFSIFDIFSRPKKERSFSYKYCGLKGESGTLLTSKRIRENFENAVMAITLQSRDGTWINTMGKIIGEELSYEFYNEFFDNRNYDVFGNDSSKVLSSGQSFLISTITEVIANIRENSLLLFDEPEMHLHPNAIANLMRAIDSILIKFDSYAIIATHSPIILQEIPSRYVRIFDRVGSIPYVRRLNIESFGENLDLLSEEVFQTKDVKGGYMEVLKQLSNIYDYDYILGLFNNNLSLNAKAYLYNIYNEKP